MLDERFTVDQPSRQTRLGWCHILSTSDGRRYTGLRLDSIDPVALERLDAAARAAAATGLPGLVPVVDRIQHDGTTWLISNVTGCTLAQALAADVPITGPDAALIATDTAQTLVKLHQAGLVHGDVNPATVVLSTHGAALLDQPGYAQALHDTVASAGSDAVGWAQMLGLITMRCADQQVTTLLRQAAAYAQDGEGSSGLGTALQLLGPALARVGGFGDRSALAAFADSVSAARSPSTPAGSIGAAKQIRAVAAVPVRSAPTPPPTPPPTPAVAAAPPAIPSATPPAAADDATRLGQRAAEQHPHPPAPPTQGSSSEVLRFGRGVPPTIPSWQAATAANPVDRRKGSVFKRISSVLSTLLTLVLLVVVGLYLWQRFNPDPIVITDIAVGTAEPVTGKCNVDVDLVGTIRTNGEAGMISYEWLLSDGRREGPLSQAVRQGEQTAQVHLFWKFRGTGTLEAKATLRILTPTSLEESTEFTYTCR